MIRKSASCHVYNQLTSSGSDTSTATTSSSGSSKTTLKKFNRLLRASVARHWSYFKKDRPSLRTRGRSMSDAALCEIVDHGLALRPKSHLMLSDAVAQDGEHVKPSGGTGNQEQLLDHTYSELLNGWTDLNEFFCLCSSGFEDGLDSQISPADGAAADPELMYLDIPSAFPRRSLQVFGSEPVRNRMPTLLVTSAGGSGSHVGLEEASDGSDAERPRRGHHLRVPTPVFHGQSTGNFAQGASGGGSGAPRSAPATPLQLESQSRTSKHDRQAVKPLSGSAPSVRIAALGPSSDNGDATDGKQPSKSRQKKFQRHFPQVGPEERVLNYYSCALVGDLLLQGHLYITKNYFAFYSNVFGYVTKLLIPTTSVLRITKEKVARIIPNAVGVCTRDERHVFGSLLSRDSTYKLMTHVWKATRVSELTTPKPQDRHTSEVELDASEYSPEDDSSSVGGDQPDASTLPALRESESIITGGAAVIQPALLTGSSAAPKRSATQWGRVLLVSATALFTLTAILLSYKLYVATYHDIQKEELLKLSGEELYSELLRWRNRLHGRAATELHSFLTTNLLLLTKVRQSLEALSGVILTDMAQSSTAHVNIDVPNDAVFS